MSRHVPLSRRQFVKRGSTLVAAGLSVPYFVPSTVLAAPGRPGANSRIQVAYIGCGRRSAQLRNLPAEGRIVAAADCDVTRAEQVAAQYKGVAYQDYRRLLDLKDVDAVIVASPDHWHALHTIHACQAGKDVYVEKPMTLTIREGRQMVDAARKYGRIVQVGSQQRSMAANRHGCELIRNGRIGVLKRVISATYPSPWHCDLPGQPTPKGLHWDMWCGQTGLVPFHSDIFVPRAKPGWISFRPWSGGEMTGWGSHGLDQIQWALGMDASGPVEVWTDGKAFAPPVYSEPESRARGEAACRSPAVFYRYANGAVVEQGQAGPGGGTFIGAHGTIKIDRGQCAATPPELARQPVPASGVHLARSDNHMQNWFDSIKSRKRPVADVEIGHRTATVCHLGNIARQLGRKLRWDPEQERFTDDDEANALTERRQRKPYQIPEPV